MEDFRGQKFVPFLGVNRKPVLEFKELSPVIKVRRMGNDFGNSQLDKNASHCKKYVITVQLYDIQKIFRDWEFSQNLRKFPASIKGKIIMLAKSGAIGAVEETECSMCLATSAV